MSLSVRQIPAAFAAEILGADLHREPSRALVDTVNAAVAEHAVVVLRDQAVSDEEHVRFSRAFGPLELPPQINLRGSIRRRRLGPELYDVSNLDARLAAHDHQRIRPGNILDGGTLPAAVKRNAGQPFRDASLNLLAARRVAFPRPSS